MLRIEYPQKATGTLRDVPDLTAEHAQEYPQGTPVFDDMSCVVVALETYDAGFGVDAQFTVTPELHGALTAFRLPGGLDPVALRRTLWEQYHIEAPIIERPEGLLIRVSTHFYNTEEEIDRLAGALEVLSREWCSSRHNSAAVSTVRGSPQWSGCDRRRRARWHRRRSPCRSRPVC